MKRNKRSSLMFLVFVFWASPVFSAHGTNQKTIDLVYSTFFPCTSVQAQLNDAWAREIEKRANGRVKISSFPGWPTLKGNEIYEGVRIGAMDIGMSAFAYNQGRFPAMEAIDLPLGYPSATVATSVINDFYQQYKPKELADIKVLYLHAHGPGLLHSRKPVYKLEDLRGMRVRASGFCAKIVTALGAEPLFKPQGYTYAYLVDHYVDATCSPMEVLKEWRQAEVINYTIDCHCLGYTSGLYVVMNQKTWNSLPEGIKEVFERVSAEWIGKHAKAWDDSDEEGRTFTLSLDNKIIPLSEEESARWCKAVKPVIDDYMERAESMGLPGKEYVETIRELIKKYGKM